MTRSSTPHLPTAATAPDPQSRGASAVAFGMLDISAPEHAPEVLGSVAAAHIDHFSELYIGDCVEFMSSLAEASVDAVVTDPPYAIGRVRLSEGGATAGLMAAPMLGMQSTNWHEKATHSRGYADNDNVAFGEWCSLWLAECFRVLKPGGHLVAFGGTRTWHRLACAVEDAGFEIRDNFAWLYATGFPKSMDVARQVARKRLTAAVHAAGDASDGSGGSGDSWEGWGTALKPAHEPIVLARKPLIGTVAENVLTHRVGALNVGETRIKGPVAEGSRWPTNVFMDSVRADELDAVAGSNASRFFWVAKPGASERPRVGGVSHPTVKPLGLMRELVRLVTPPGGLVLDPFAGSGTSVEACLQEGLRVIAVEREPAYLPLILQRIDRRLAPTAAANNSGEDPGLFASFED